jgi:translation initiation factor 2 subunit 1
MLFRRSGFPQEGEIVLCQVEKLSKGSVFVSFMEYDGLSGIISISEVAPGRIRTVRDYVKQGMVIVCKVLRAIPERRHFELSLRRVSEKERKKKLDFMKQEQSAEKIVEFVAGKLSLDFHKMYDSITEELFKDYSSLYEAFYEISMGNKDFSNIDISQEAKDLLKKTIEERIKPKIMIIEGYFVLTATAENGVELIKEAFSKLDSLDKSSAQEFKITYSGRGKYHFYLRGSDYKDMEDFLQKAVDILEDFSKKNKMEFSLERKD